MERVAVWKEQGVLPPHFLSPLVITESIYLIDMSHMRAMSRELGSSTFLQVFNDGILIYLVMTTGAIHHYVMLLYMSLYLVLGSAPIAYSAGPPTFIQSEAVFYCLSGTLSNMNKLARSSGVGTRRNIRWHISTSGGFRELYVL